MGFTSGCEAGFSTFLFSDQQRALAAEWAGLARCTAFFALPPEGGVGAGLQGLPGSTVVDGSGSVVARIHSVAGPSDLLELEAALTAEAAAAGSNQQGQQQAQGGGGSTIIADCTAWRIIPAENLVALAASSRTRVLATVNTAREAEVMLGALEVGVLVRKASGAYSWVCCLETWMEAVERQWARISASSPAICCRQSADIYFSYGLSLSRTHIHTHSRARTHTQTHTYTHTRAHTHTHTHARMHAHTRIHTSTHACTHTQTHTHTCTLTDRG